VHAVDREVASVEVVAVAEVVSAVVAVVAVAVSAVVTVSIMPGFQFIKLSTLLSLICYLIY
jgi:hypothetical protein